MVSFHILHVGSRCFDPVNTGIVRLDNRKFFAFRQLIRVLFEPEIQVLRDEWIGLTARAFVHTVKLA